MELDAGFDKVKSVPNAFGMDGKRLYLIRLPAELDIDVLKGKKVTLGSADGIVKDKIQSSNGLYRMLMEQGTNLEAFRSVTSDEKGMKVGAGFAGCISVVRDVMRETGTEEEEQALTCPLVIPDQYRKREQVPGLMARSMPPGSRTSIDDLRKAKGTVPATTSTSSTTTPRSKSSKRDKDKQAGATTAPRRDSIGTDSDGGEDEDGPNKKRPKSEKKQKKDKKDKKDKK